MGVAWIKRVFLGKGEVEIFPRNVTDMAEEAEKDVKYKALIEFFEGERDWASTEGDVMAYKNISDVLSVDKFGDGKMLGVDGTS